MVTATSIYKSTLLKYTNMNAEQLYEEGCAHRSRALENTQFTHVHSVDIEDDVFKNYFLPSAQQGYPPAIV